MLGLSSPGIDSTLLTLGVTSSKSFPLQDSVPWHMGVLGVQAHRLEPPAAAATLAAFVLLLARHPAYVGVQGLGRVLPRGLVPSVPSEGLPSPPHPQLGVEYALGAKRRRATTGGVLSSSDGNERRPGAAQTSEEDAARGREPPGTEWLQGSAEEEEAAREKGWVASNCSYFTTSGAAQGRRQLYRFICCFASSKDRFVWKVNFQGYRRWSLGNAAALDQGPLDGAGRPLTS